MQTRYSRLTAVLMILAACRTPFFLRAEAPPSAVVGAPFAGTWNGKVNNLLAVHLTINEAGEKISGNVVFFMQNRLEEGGAWRVVGEYRAPLLAPHVEGRALLFEVEHHKCHGCAELGPNSRFRMELASPDEARLWNLSERAGSSPWMVLSRQTDTNSGAAQALQKGITVDLPVTSSATRMPDADKEGALIVAVTSDGVVFLGTRSTAASASKQEVEKWLASSADKKVYIKADARSPYANVIGVLDALHAAGVKSVVFLSDQMESRATGTLVPPSGLEVLTNSPGRPK